MDLRLQNESFEIKKRRKGFNGVIGLKLRFKK